MTGKPKQVARDNIISTLLSVASLSVAFILTSPFNIEPEAGTLLEGDARDFPNNLSFPEVDSPEALPILYFVPHSTDFFSLQKKEERNQKKRNQI